MASFPRVLLVAACTIAPTLLSAQALSTPQVRTGVTSNSTIPSFFASSEFTFGRFNPRLGTLQKVRLQLTGSQTFSTAITPALFEATASISPTFSPTVDYLAQYNAQRSLNGTIRVPSADGATVLSLNTGDFITESFRDPENLSPRTVQNTVNFSRSVEFTSGNIFNAFLGVDLSPIQEFFSSANRMQINAFGFTSSLSGTWAEGGGFAEKNDSGNYSLSLVYEYAPATVAVVPEPNTVLLLAGGFLGLAIVGWRRRDRVG